MTFFKYFSHAYLKLSLIIIIAFGTSDSYGQLSYGLRGSGNWNSYIFVDDVGATDYKGRLNYSIGYLMESQIKDKLIIVAGLNYTSKNYIEEIDLGKYRALGNDPILYDEIVQRTYNHSFIELPLSIKWKIIEEHRYYFYPTFGIAVAKRLNYKINSSRGNADSIGANSGRYNNLLLSTKIGFGVFFRKENLGIGIEPNCNFYLNKVHLNYPKQNPIFIGLDVYVLRF